ncbi:response regulator receiver domain-containing protein [Azomonas agilis]|uniref:Response regulator receiver domain-containing protein n=1 Tax=Azomonas agilis TaxID=116849 RepID=A0A562I0M4_9GAMM|nr:response regulator [Azomonas agilis]TWH64195.1 response regulator receiver domain-containing protein [Azomonas agilis]
MSVALKILVVDDAAFIRDLVKKGLRTYFPDIQLEEAADGRKAQHLMQNMAFDLVLCDWEMPEMSGLELLGWCRVTAGLDQIPFIMVTSRGDKDHVVQAIQAGVTDYIGKPFSAEQLINKVRKALARAGKLQDPKLMKDKDKPSTPTAPKMRFASAGVAKPSLNNQGHLRLASGKLSCIIKSLSLKEAVLIVKRTEYPPQIMESAVLDLEQGEHLETARLNGYLQAISGLEPRPDTEWLQLNFYFVDADPQKMDYLSRLITANTLAH